MIIGYCALTEITIEKDFELYYGPTKASSTIVLNGRFRLHILPENITSILIVSRDFAGSQVDREALYGLQEALDMKFIQPILLKVDEQTGLGVFGTPTDSSALKPYNKKKSKKLKNND